MNKNEKNEKNEKKKEKVFEPQNLTPKQLVRFVCFVWLGLLGLLCCLFVCWGCLFVCLFVGLVYLFVCLLGLFVCLLGLLFVLLLCCLFSCVWLNTKTVGSLCLFVCSFVCWGCLFVCLFVCWGCCCVVCWGCCLFCSCFVFLFFLFWCVVRVSVFVLSRVCVSFLCYCPSLLFLGFILEMGSERTWRRTCVRVCAVCSHCVYTCCFFGLVVCCVFF